MTALDVDLGLEPDGDSVDLDFAARAAVYLRSKGLDPDAISDALRTELGVSPCDAIRLAARNPSLAATNQPQQGESTSWN